MSNLLDRFKEPGPTSQYVGNRKKYPDGWQPRLELDETDGGFLVSMPTEIPRAHEEILDEFGLSGDDWIVDRVRKSRWQGFSGEWLESSRLSLLPKKGALASRVDLADLEKTIKDWRPTSEPRSPQNASFVAPTGDTQIGKAHEAGGGSKETVERVLREHGKGFERFKFLDERIGFEQVVLPQLGDCIEGRTSQNGKNVWRTDLSMTEMVRVYRRLLWNQIKMYSAHLPVMIPVVPGNHDEARDFAGTVATDSWAIDAASALHEAVQENNDLADWVKFVFPDYDELSVVLDVSGTVMGCHHGHTFGADPLKWWNNQAGMRSPIGDAGLLICGHLHHLKVLDHAGGRTFLQVPALDGGSRWFEHTKGTNAPARAITFWTSDGGIFELDPVGRSL